MILGVFFRQIKVSKKHYRNITWHSVHDLNL